ncbi:MAG: choice-of-anchor J domain-containing protein [candidate division Zixibacteria bacterium]|nr:choice-of-anchor J domain-containing protein [candidate division Zixibacteria bacterium]
MTNGRKSPMLVIALIMVFSFSVLAFGADEKPEFIRTAVSPTVTNPEHVESTVPLVGDPSEDPATDPDADAETIRIDEESQPGDQPVMDPSIINPAYQGEDPNQEPNVAPDPSPWEIEEHDMAASNTVEPNVSKEGIKVLSLGHTKVTRNPATIFLAEDFGTDSTYPYPPTGWSEINTDPGYGWYYGTWSGGGTQAALCKWHAAGFIQDEWLMTPDVDVSTATSNLKLDFWMLKGYTYPHEFNVYVSTNSGTDWTEVFDSDTSGYPDFAWHFVSVDLSAYAGGSDIMVGFQYYGEDADLFGLDDVSLNDDDAAIGRCCYGDVSAPTCEDNTSVDCAALGGDWDGALNCTDDPCPVSTPPDNDNCADATAIGDVVDLAWSTTEATLDGTDTWIVSPDVWFCYTATCTGEATASLCGTDWDTRIQVFDGCSCDPIGTKIGEDDDDCDASPGSGLASTFTFAVVSGQSYLIRAGGYQTNAGDGVLTVSCVNMSDGACCFDDGTCDGPMTTEACTSAGGTSWIAGGTCDPNLCPQPAQPGDNCENPLYITLPAGLPYADNNTTCGRLDDYENTGLGYYDSGEDIIYEVTVTEAITVDISLDPLSTTYSGISIGTLCPDDETSLVAFSTNSSAGVHGMTEVVLAAGTYYIMIDTWSTPDCIPEFNLTIASGITPEGRCCYGDPVACEDDTEAECTALGGTWTEGLNCTDNPCPTGTPANDDCVDAIDVTGTYPVTVDGDTFGATIDCPDATDNWSGVWYKFDLPYASNNVYLDFCNTPTEMSSISAALWVDCTCDTTTYILFSGGEFYDCGDGYNVPKFNFDQIPGPVTVYYCVSADGAKTEMDFHFTVDVQEYTLPTGRCCYGDPLAPDCDDITEAACTALSGTWAEGLNCTDNPCPIAGPGDDCSDPLTDIKFPADLPWADLGQTTCGHGNFYEAADMCYTYGYGGGEDLVYSFDVDETITIALTMDPKGTGWWFVQISDVCVPAAGECTYFFKSTAGDPLTSEAITLAPGTYYMIVDTWPSPDCLPAFDLTIDIATAPIGRCCYGDPLAPDCDDLEEADCMALSGTWTADQNCTDNPCVAVTPGDDCTDPYMVKLPDDLPFANTNYTCERGNNYQETCLGSYDGGEDIIYELDVDGAIVLDIMLDPKATTWTGIAIFDACPDVATDCIVSSTASGATVHGLEGVALTTGLYYIMVDTYPSPDCIPEFDLTITEAGQEMGRCCYGDGLAPSCSDEIEVVCIGRPDWLSFTAGLNCTDNPCQASPDNDNCDDVTPFTLTSGVPQVVSGDNTNSTGDCGELAPATEAWEAFTIDTLMNVTIDYCGTDPAFELVYVILFTDCPCDAAGQIFATSSDWDACGNGNVTMLFEALPAGTYYLPVLASHPDYPTEYYEGPYTVTFNGVAISPGYCSASGGCDEYISRVAVSDIDNSSACDGYADYTSIIGNMAFGGSFPITVENGNPYSTDECAVWVDWNQDLDFSDAGEEFYLGVGTGPYTGTIVVPGTALGGMTRMRVRINYNAAPPMCGVTSYGEVEDYTINVGGELSVLTFDPTSIDFGIVPVGSAGNTALTLGAVGSADIGFSFDYEYLSKQASVGGGTCTENLKASPFQSAGHAPEGQKNVKSIFFEGFEGGVVPPTGWTSIVANAFTWVIDDVAFYEGSYAASCSYDDQLGTQDEWLITPTLDLSGGTYALDFWWYGSYYWAVDPENNYDLEVWISIDGGATWLVQMWNEDVHGLFVNWEWNNAVVDLSAFEGESNVKLAFRYYGSDGAQWAIDAIDVYEFTAPLNWLSATPETGSVPGDGSLPISIGYDMSGLEEGVYNANLLLTHNGADRGLVTIPVTIEVGVVAAADIIPNPMYALYAFAIDPIMGTAFVETDDLAGGYTTADINTGSVTLNGLTPSTITLNGDVLEIGFFTADFIGTYPLLWDVVDRPYTIAGDYSDTSPFSLEYTVTTWGHASGDANLDGQTNVGDAVFIINHVFSGGAAPKVMETANANCDASLNVGDAVYLINYIFRGGTAPCHTTTQ